MSFNFFTPNFCSFFILIISEKHKQFDKKKRGFCVCFWLIFLTSFFSLFFFWSKFKKVMIYNEWKFKTNEKYEFTLNIFILSENQSSPTESLTKFHQKFRFKNMIFTLFPHFFLVEIYEFKTVFQSRLLVLIDRKDFSGKFRKSSRKFYIFFCTFYHFYRWNYFIQRSLHLF